MSTLHRQSPAIWPAVGPCTRWPSSEAFWDEPVAPPIWAEMGTKYATLIAATTGASVSRARCLLRDAAARWPGSLKECQLVSPAQYAQRCQWARAAAQMPARSRGTWGGTGSEAILLWYELHALLRDVGQMRGSTLASGLGRLEPSRCAHWPRQDRLTGPWLHVRPCSQVARQWLAQIVGWDTATLTRTLLPAARFGI